MKRFLPVFFLISSLATARADQAFSIFLDGLQETPPNASPGFGSGTGFYDSTAGTIMLSISFSGLVAPLTADHIHTNAPGLPGPVIVDLFPITTGIGLTSGTIAGTLPFPAAHVANLLAGNTYVNLHSTAFPGGEIRGQLIAVPEPATVILTGAGLLGLALVRRRHSPVGCGSGRQDLTT